MTAKELLQAIKNDTYTCTVCGETIYPIIKGVDVENGVLDITNTSACIRAGFGNKIIKENICNDCINKMVI